MDCSQVKNLLSAFYDDELAADEQTAVAGHLGACADCARELAGFQSLSVLAETEAHPEPPPHIWQQLESQLDADGVRGFERSAFFHRLGWVSKPAARFGWAVAAAVLIAVAWLGYANWSPRGEQKLADVFGRYLEAFRDDPGAAHHILLANYQGLAVDAEQAVHTVGYRPVVADGMPEGYSIESTYVMKMLYVTCVKCLCKRSDGSSIAIFEHDDQDLDWFGDLPTTQAFCNGRPCSVVDLDNRLAASWQHENRQITVVGLEDAAEADRLIAWFHERRPTRQD
jgi:hypothetical protein